MSAPAATRALLAAALALGAPAAAAQSAPAASQPSAGLSLGDVVRTTLERSPSIAAAGWEVEARLGALRQAQGAYDPVLGAGAATLRSPVASVSEQGVASMSRATSQQYRLGVDQRLRSGATLSPSLVMERNDGAGQFPYSRAEVGATLTLPLMRGRGETPERAGERAAGVEVNAARADLRHRRAASVLDAVLAYWEYAAAARRLDVLRQAAERAATLLSETEALIRADVRPAIDAVPLRASLASHRADVIAGEDALLEARRGVAVAMGISAEEFRALAPPSTPFPAAAAIPSDDALVGQALRDRADLAAARGREVAARALLAGAHAERRPQLDLRVRAGVAGVEGSQGLSPLLTPFYGDRSGLQLEMDVAYGIPVRNRAAEGAALQRAAADRQAALEAAELTRAVTLDVLSAAALLRSSLAGLELGSEAVRLHREAVDAERSKFRLGTATLFDVLFAEDALTGATLAEIAARQRVAGALARLRFQSGALAGGADGESVDADALTRWDAPPAN